MNLKFLCVSLAALALLSACTSPTATTTTQSVAPAQGAVIASDSKLLDTSGEIAMPDVGQTAPDFSYTLADGSTVKLSDLRGKKVVVNFWATWCEPCREEMPDLDQARQKYGDDVVILAVNKAEKLNRINDFTSQVPVGFTLVANPAGDISERYGTRTIPNTFFINSDGTIGARELRIMNYDTITKHLDALR